MLCLVCRNQNKRNWHWFVSQAAAKSDFCQMLQIVGLKCALSNPFFGYSIVCKLLPFPELNICIQTSMATPLKFGNGSVILSHTFECILFFIHAEIIPDSKVHGAKMGAIWGRQDPGGPHVGSMKFAIWDSQSMLVKRAPCIRQLLAVTRIKIIWSLLFPEI